MADNQYHDYEYQAESSPVSTQNPKPVKSTLSVEDKIKYAFSIIGSIIFLTFAVVGSCLMMGLGVALGAEMFGAGYSSLSVVIKGLVLCGLGMAAIIILAFVLRKANAVRRFIFGLSEGD